MNQLRQATSIDWHGVELESYYDGVPGWGAKGYELTPVVKLGGSFVVRCTPARAMKDAQQELSSAEIYDFEYTPREPDGLRLEVANSVLNSKIVQPIEVQ